MARKKRKKRGRKGRGKGTAALSDADFMLRLENALKAGKYQEAISAGKKLLGREISDELAGKARGLLWQAYRGRILALCSKNMFKEAVSLIDTAVTRCGDQDDMAGLRLSVCIRGGRWQEAVETWFERRNSLDNAAKAEVIFAAMALAGPENVAEIIKSGLPGDSPVNLHLPHARQALDAFCEGQYYDEARRALKGIPFRSPYRDFRSLLSGCIMLAEGDVKGAGNFFSKVDNDSPWSKAASMLPLSDTSPEMLLEYISGSGHGDDTMLAALLNLKPDDLKLLREIHRAEHNGMAMLRAIERYGKTLPKDVKRRLVIRLLPHAGEKIIDISEFRRLDDLEKHRLYALATELEHDFYAATMIWRDYLRLLPENTPDARLRKAPVMRHCVSLMEKDPWEYDKEDVVELLIDSLEYEPDADAYLEVIERLEALEDKRAYSILNDALKKFPEDVRVLVKAMEAASRRNAHKKAARIARQILELDPVNGTAKEFLLKSHLSHAFKLIRQYKFHLVEQEFEAAEKIDIRYPSWRGRPFMDHGLFLYMEDEEDRGNELIDRGCAINGLAVASRVLVLMDAFRMGLDASVCKKFEQQLRLNAKQAPVKGDALQIARLCMEHADTDRYDLEVVLKLLKGYLSRAVQLEWNMQEGMILCRGFYRAGLMVQLEKLAGKFHKACPDDKEFEAYFLLSRTRHGTGMGRKHIARMLDLADELFEENMPDLAVKLEEAFDRLDHNDDDGPPFGIDQLFRILSGKVDMEELADVLNDNILPDSMPEEFPDTNQEKKSGKKKRGRAGKRQRSLFDLLD